MNLSIEKTNQKLEGGTRKSGRRKVGCDETPLVTIVTVVFNGAVDLDVTINSVLNQTYQNVEYIVIDGGSVDGTLDIIRKYDEKLDYWVSEPDFGLYFAMNKGLQLATGKWINFMNCGDSFFSNQTIDEIFSIRREGILYGDVMFHFNHTNAVYVKAKELSNFWKGMQFVHQTAFVPTSIMNEIPFDTNYKFVADYNSLYQMYLNNVNFSYTGITVCNFLAGGLSDNNPKAILECERVLYGLHGSYRIRAYYFLRYIECFIKFNFAKLIGNSLYSMLRVKKDRLRSLLLKS